MALLTQDDLNQLSYWIDSDEIKDHVKIGDTFDIEYAPNPTATIPLRVVSYGVGGKCLEFETDCVFGPQVWSSTNTTKFTESNLVSFYGTADSLFPASFVQCLANSNHYQYLTTDDVEWYGKFYPPAVGDYGGGDSTQQFVEAFTYSGSYYQLNTASSLRKKKIFGLGGTYGAYWTVSNYSDTYAYIINNAGDITYRAKNGGNTYVAIRCTFEGNGWKPAPVVKTSGLYVSYNNVTTQPKSVLVPYNGTSKTAIKGYASKDGIASTIFPKMITPEPDVNYIDLKITKLGSSTKKITIHNMWEAGYITVSSLYTGDTATLYGGASPSTFDFTSIHVGDIIRIEEGNNAFRTWASGSLPLVQALTLYGIDLSTEIQCLHMPAIDAFTVDEAGTIAGKNFFDSWNKEGNISKLPDGSFNTSKITSVQGNYHFNDFNRYGIIRNVPSGSFNFPNLLSVGDGFMANFNYAGYLQYIPLDCFNTKNITTAGSGYLGAFNGYEDNEFGPSSGNLTRGNVGSPNFINNVGTTDVVYSSNPSATNTIAKGNNLYFANSVDDVI